MEGGSRQDTICSVVICFSLSDSGHLPSSQEGSPQGAQQLFSASVSLNLTSSSCTTEPSGLRFALISYHCLMTAITSIWLLPPMSVLLESVCYLNFSSYKIENLHLFSNNRGKTNNDLLYSKPGALRILRSTGWSLPMIHSESRAHTQSLCQSWGWQGGGCFHCTLSTVHIPPVKQIHRIKDLPRHSTTHN